MGEYVVMKVYQSALNENEELREQNRVLRLEFQSLLNVIDDSYDEDLPVEIVEARNKAQAALTATSQPAKE